MPVGFANVVPGHGGPDQVLPCMAAFQAARVEFAQEVAKLALPDDPAACRSAGAPGGTYEVDGPEKVLATLEASFTLMPELRALLNDLAPTVRENAMLAVGRLGRLSDNLNAQIAEEDTLGAAITTIAAGAPSGLVKAALFLLHSAVRCSAEVAQAADAELNERGAIMAAADATATAAATYCS